MRIQHIITKVPRHFQSYLSPVARKVLARRRLLPHSQIHRLRSRPTESICSERAFNKQLDVLQQKYQEEEKQIQAVQTELDSLRKNTKSPINHQLNLRKPTKVEA